MDINYELTFPLVEHFISINGEGRRAGQLALFIRLAGCNLDCSYCDTKWANKADVKFEKKTIREIVDIVKNSNCKNVTLTGGEPLLKKDVDQLIAAILELDDIRLEIETNGSQPIKKYDDWKRRPVMTLDYKLASSGCEAAMDTENFNYLHKEDSVKFVSGSRADLERTLEIITKYDLTSKANCIISPVFGQIEPVEIVDFMKEHEMNDVFLQLQMHKIIWDPDKQGV